ncbi:MAG: serine carboxypeptidase [Anaerolineales bacterium]
MKKVLVIHLNEGEEKAVADLLGQQVEVRYVGCGGDPERAKAFIREHDGKVDAIGLEGLPRSIQLAGNSRMHRIGEELFETATKTPIVDGSGVRASLESWSLILADRMHPGLFGEKRVLMVPGLNHDGLVRAFSRFTSEIRYADPVVYFNLPDFPGIGAHQLAKQIANPTLEQLKDAPFRRIFPQPGTPGTPRGSKAFEWADVLAGDVGAIRRYAPQNLKRKIIVVDWARREDLDDLRQRNAAVVISLIPLLEGDGGLDHRSSAMVEAMLAALRSEDNLPLNENTYLDMVSALEWQPTIRHLDQDTQVNKFAFVIHPLNIKFIHKHKLFRWTKYLPDSLVEWAAAFMPPMYLSRITGGQSPTTGQKIEGYLITLAATPREMMRRSERFTYTRLNQAAKMAERLGARIMGLGAFTSVVGDAGITVAHEADIAITSGNSLTVAATLEAAKQAVIKMGATDLTKGKAMVVGATGSIGSVCARLLAQAVNDVVLVSIEPAKLIDLKKIIQEETPSARVSIATRTDEHIGDCDLIVTATSAFGQRVIDITKCKPGAVICDVARPPDINAAEGALRPDVLVIESGEILIPGDIDFGYDIGLPPKTAYACLAETALLAMEGRFEDYTLGRNITMERVKEIYRLFKKHQFQLAGLRSFDNYVTDDYVAEKRKLAEELRRDPERFAILRAEASAKLAEIPVMAKGVKASSNNQSLVWGAAIAGLLGTLFLLRRRK